MQAAGGVPGTLKRAALSLFIALNLGTVLLINLPPEFVRGGIERMASGLSPAGGHRLRHGDWLMRRYAHTVGLDNAWQMFGWQPRHHWWYVIKGRYENGREVVLPLPMQSQRSLAEQLFWDFKDAKIYLNLYRQPEWRQAFAYHLCRQHPVHEGAPIRAIVFELHWRAILEPEEAELRGEHLAPDEHSMILHIVYRP